MVVGAFGVDSLNLLEHRRARFVRRSAQTSRSLSNKPHGASFRKHNKIQQEVISPGVQSHDRQRDDPQDNENSDNPVRKSSKAI